MSARRRWVLVAIAVVAVAVASLATWAAVGRGTPDGTPATSTSPGCTEEDPCLDEPATDGPGTDVPGTGAPGTDTPGAGPSASLTDVELLVTSSGWDPDRRAVWVAGDVPVVESDGTCTATLKHGADQVEESVPAEAGPRTTTCAVEVDGARLSSGDWLVILSYVSAHHSAAGPEVSINVP